MPVFSLIFNKLQIEIPAEKLSLYVESYISFQSSNGNTGPTKTKEQLDLLCSGRTWVTRGTGCRIDFIILAGGSIKKPFMKKMIEEFAHFVRDAPLWPEVSLHPELAFLEDHADRNSQPSFSIILRHPLLGYGEGRSDLAQSYQAPDIHAPTGIPEFQLRKVTIAMTFRFGTDSKFPRPFLQSTIAVSPEGDLERKYQPGNELERLSRYFLPHKAVHQDFGNNFSASKSCFNKLLHDDHEMLADDPFLENVNFATQMQTSGSLCKNLPYLSSLLVSQEKESGKVTASRDVASCLSNLRCAGKIAHLAFRKVIGGRQNKIQHGIKVGSGRPALTLSRIAPNLFSPGFAEAMSQRSVFVPSISHALSVSLLRNVQSPSLRRKLFSLVSDSDRPSDKGDVGKSYLNRGNSYDSCNRIPSISLRETIETRLWTMMQDSLYHPSLTPRILPSQDLDNIVSEARAGGLNKTINGELKEAERMTGESSLFLDPISNFSNEDFEDLLSNKGVYNESETLLDDDIMEVDFEDLLGEEPGDYGGDESAEEYDMDFDMIIDEGCRYQRESENIVNNNPLGDYFSGRHHISDIENEDMLI